MVEIGNKYYYIYILFAIFIFLIIYFILRKANKQTQYKTLLVMAFANLGLHFLKLVFSPYKDNLPYSIKNITFANICAVTTLIMPWIYLYRKSSTLNSYIFFIGIIGGIGAMVYPTEAINKYPFAFDTIRFYLCHMCLFIVPLLGAMLGVFTPKLNKTFLIPVVFLLVEVIILLNEILLIKVGLVNSTWIDFFDRNIRNTSFIFGPTNAFDKISFLFLIFVPKIFTRNIFGVISGIDFYWPVIWMIIPVFIYFPVIYCLMALPFYKKKDKSNEYKQP